TLKVADESLQLTSLMFPTSEGFSVPDRQSPTLARDGLSLRKNSQYPPVSTRATTTTTTAKTRVLMPRRDLAGAAATSGAACLGAKLSASVVSAVSGGPGLATSTGAGAGVSVNWSAAPVDCCGTTGVSDTEASDTEASGAGAAEGF